MRLILAILLWSLRAAFRSRSDLVFVNLALRQQLATFARGHKRPMLKPDERKPVTSHPCDPCALS
jgi:hypothetical protein